MGHTKAYIGVCEDSHTYLLGCLRYLEKHKFIVSLTVGVCLFVVYKHVIEM